MNRTKIHLIFHLFCFRFISAAIICLFVLSFSLSLTPYFSVKYQEKELFTAILSCYILSKLNSGNFPWAACQQSGCHNSFDLWYNKYFFLMRNEHSFPTAGIHTFPEKLGNTASFGVQQQNSVGVYVGGEREERAEWEASERNIHFSLCFWLLSCSWKEEGMELGFLLRRGTDASCSPKTVQRGWQLFQLSCYVFLRQHHRITNSVEVGLETTLKPAVTFMSCFGASRQ